MAKPTWLWLRKIAKLTTELPQICGSILAFVKFRFSMVPKPMFWGCWTPSQHRRRRQWWKVIQETPFSVPIHLRKKSAVTADYCAADLRIHISSSRSTCLASAWILHVTVLEMRTFFSQNGWNKVACNCLLFEHTSYCIPNLFYSFSFSGSEHRGITVP